MVSIKSDKEVKEAYRHLSVEDINDRIASLSAILKDANTYKIFKSDIIEKKVLENTADDFRYLKLYGVNEKGGFLINSVNPRNIEGAKIVWTLNTKYNFLNCIRGNSLSVKGSRIIGEDLNKSWAKIVKYDIKEVFFDINHELDPEIIKGKIKNQKEYKATMLSNDNTSILKVIK